MQDMEILAADTREFLYAPWLVPFKTAVQTFFGVVYAVGQLRDTGKQSASAFKIDGADFYIAGAW